MKIICLILVTAHCSCCEPVSTVSRVASGLNWEFGVVTQAVERWLACSGYLLNTIFRCFFLN